MKKLIVQEPGKINVLFKVLWGAGYLGGGVIAGVSAAFQLIYYQNYLGLPAQMFSICIVAYTLLNAITNPFLAYISDQTRSSKGRRVPYFRLSAPFVALSFVMLYFVPLQANLLVKAWWLFLCLMIFDIAYSMYCGMYINLQTEITEHENERVDLQFSCEIANYIGTVIGMIVPGMISLNINSAESISSFKEYMILTAVIGLALMLVTSFVVKERTELLQNSSPTQKRSLKAAVAEYISIIKIKPIRSAVLINFFANGAVNLTTPLLYYIAIFVAHIDSSVFVMIVMIPMVIGSVVWMRVQRKVGAVKTAEIALLGACFFYFLSALIYNSILIAIGFAFAGFFISGFRLIIKLLLSDCVDYDACETGVRREGVIFGASTLTNTLTFMLIAIIPQVLEMSGFITAAENNGINMLNQPASAIWGIKGLIMFCGTLAVIAYILLLRHPLKGQKLKEVREKILSIQSGA